MQAVDVIITSGGVSMGEKVKCFKYLLLTLSWPVCKPIEFGGHTVQSFESSEYLTLIMLEF